MPRLLLAEKETEAETDLKTRTGKKLSFLKYEQKLKILQHDHSIFEKGKG